eukprot:m.133205 g.133205  ORF g.133205 m.133205 type:complete len:139 (-) comp23803_c0_seq1:35-451(-)
MTDWHGLGAMNAKSNQNVATKDFYEDIPKETLYFLPYTLPELNWYVRDLVLRQKRAGILGETPWLLGFLLGFKQSSGSKEFEGLLLNPELVNVHQERELLKRFPDGGVRIAQHVFVIHDKGSTLGDNIEHKDKLERFH